MTSRYFLVKKVGKIQLPLQMSVPKTHFQTQEPGLLADKQLHCEVKSRAGIKLYKTGHREKKCLPSPLIDLLCPAKTVPKVQSATVWFGMANPILVCGFIVETLHLGKCSGSRQRGRIFLKRSYKSHAWKLKASMLGNRKCWRQINPSLLQDLSVLAQYSFKPSL